MSASRVITESDTRLRSMGEQVTAAIEAIDRAASLREIGTEAAEMLKAEWLHIGRTCLDARRAIVARAPKAAAEEAA